jgi:hypothetical protein
MGLFTRAAVAGTAALLLAWVGWGLYVRRSTTTVPYERLRSLDGAQLRRYPETVLVETTAPDQRTAFRRLFDYLDGANDGGESISMTAPVETQQGESISMTAPVRSQSGNNGDSDGVRMAFYLPETYDPDSAPVPTSDEVWLRREPEQTVAATRFSWFTPDWRVERQTGKLLSALEKAGIDPDGEPALLRYNDPRTPPFMRRNEVVVGVAAEL